MVNGHHHSLSSEPGVLLHYILEEQSLVAKTGRDEDCEDAIYIGPNFVAVIDGATSKTERRWDGETGGRVAARIIGETFDQIPYDATIHQAVEILTSAIRNFYVQHEAIETIQADPVERVIAVFAAVSLWRREVWFVGDCQCMLNQECITNTKDGDKISADARSLFLEAEIAHGKTIAELMRHDTGRDFILPLLQQQMIFQNKPSTGQYWFAVIDGFDVPAEGLHTVTLSEDIETLILASDGYPYLKTSLKETEETLQEILHDDPLLFRKYKSTKGLTEGNVSYDDRAYVKLSIKKDL